LADGDGACLCGDVVDAEREVIVAGLSEVALGALGDHHVIGSDAGVVGEHDVVVVGRPYAESVHDVGPA